MKESGDSPVDDGYCEMCGHYADGGGGAVCETSGCDWEGQTMDAVLKVAGCQGSEDCDRDFHHFGLGFCFEEVER